MGFQRLDLSWSRDLRCCGLDDDEVEEEEEVVIGGKDLMEVDEGNEVEDDTKMEEN